jgi:hypothetical protein
MSKDERLPIVLMAKREKDGLDVEGGGDSADPSWMLNPNIDLEHEQTLLGKSERLLSQLNSIDLFYETFSKKEKVPAIVRMKINEKALAKRYRNPIKNIIDRTNSNKLLGVYNEYLLFEITDEDQMNSIKKKVSDIYTYYYGINCIDEFTINKPDTMFTDARTYKLKMVDFGIKNYSDAYKAKLIEAYDIIGASLIEIRYSVPLILFKTTALPSTLGKIVGFDNLLISIEPMPTVEVTYDSIDTTSSISPKMPDSNIQYPTVGVLDSGISKNQYLQQWIVGFQGPYPEKDLDRSHGTFVAGIINYGDELLGNGFTTNPCYLFDGAVMPNYSIEEDELIDNIREVISNNTHVKIWNMSLGTRKECRDDAFSDFAIALDSIQDDYNVLIIKSAGNHCNHVPQRIAQSADSVRSFTIGSIAHEDGRVLKNDLSPFSRIGRGPASIIKPELVTYGGNQAKDGKALGVKSFSTSGTVVLNNGTSFSTPRITNLSGNLFQSTNYEFSPLFIKAMMIHNSSYMYNTSDIDYKIRSFGFGSPNTVESMLYNTEHDATLVIKDTLETGHFIDIFEFPIPDFITNSGDITGQIVVTLVVNQRLSPSQGSEYCQSDIEVKLGTYDNIIDRHIEKSNLLKNPLGRENPVNLLNKSNYSKVSVKSNRSSFALFERNLIDYSAKYYPVKKYTVDLSDLTPKYKQKIEQAKNWYLQIKGLYRNDLVAQAKSDGEILNQEFCLIVTIKDPDKKHNVYDETIKKIANENFWYERIQILNDVRISVTSIGNI